MNEKSNKPTIIIAARNEPGVLGRILALCKRRQFNIDSLTAGRTNISGISHITIVFEDDLNHHIDHVILQINKLIDVIEIKKINMNDSINRELVIFVLKNQSLANKMIEDMEGKAYIKKLEGNEIVVELLAEESVIELLIQTLNMKGDVLKMIRSGVIVV